jgi:hypothetical protein
MRANSTSVRIDLLLPPSLSTEAKKRGTRGRVKRILRLASLLFDIKYPVKMETK